MTTYFTMPLDPEYLELSDKVYQNLQDRKAPPQNRTAVKSAQILVRTMLKIMVDDLCDQVEMKPLAQKIVKQMGGIIQKAINVLLDKVISKLNNRDLAPLVNHLRGLELEHDGSVGLAVEMDDDLAAVLFNAFKHIDAGDLTLARRDLIESMLGIMDLSLLVFLREPMDLLNLGMISKKVVDICLVTIKKALPPALRKITSDMNVEELQSLKGYIETFVVVKD